MLTLICLFLVFKNRIVDSLQKTIGAGNKLSRAISKINDIKLKFLIILLIFQLFCDIIMIQIVQAAFTGNANLIASATVLLITRDKDTLEQLGIDPEKAEWDFQDWFSQDKEEQQGNGTWVVDKNLLVRQKTLYVFEKATEGTFFQSIPYAVYGTGLCEAGYTAWYDYDGISVQDADPIINLVGTGKQYNITQALDKNLWIFKNDGQTPAVSPLQFVGVYSKNKMRYQLDMDYSGKFNVTDLMQGQSVDVGDKQTDEVEFARPNPLYIPDAAYSYQHGLDQTYAQADLQKWYQDLQQLSTEQQILMRAQIAFCLYGWGEGNVTGKYEANGHQLVTFSKALGDWLKQGHSISDIVNYKDYWDQSSLKIVGYSKQTLKDWVQKNLGLELTKEASQGTYVEMEGLYHIVIGYIEWMNLNDMIEQAEKQGSSGGQKSDYTDRQKVIDIANRQLGQFQYKSPGSLSGTGPDNFTVGSTLDCQSWIQWCYWQAGFNYEASWTGQYKTATDLMEISKDDVQIADLQVVYPWDSDSGIGHVWMYMGNGIWGECTPTGGTRADNWSKNFMSRNTSHYFTYTGFSKSGQSGSDQGQSDSTGNWINPVPDYTSVSRRYIDKKTHGGLDIVAPEGTPIYAAQSGTVVSTYQGWTMADGKADMQSYGNYVNIDHGNGIYTMYAHMLRTVVKPGQSVNAGDLIGYVGNTGNQFGAHCHFEIRIQVNSADGREDPDALTQYGIPSYLTIVK